MTMFYHTTLANATNNALSENLVIARLTLSVPEAVGTTVCNSAN
jgi:hypothetical protein